MDGGGGGGDGGGGGGGGGGDDMNSKTQHPLVHIIINLVILNFGVQHLWCHQALYSCNIFVSHLFNHGIYETNYSS